MDLLFLFIAHLRIYEAVVGGTEKLWLKTESAAMTRRWYVRTSPFQAWKTATRPCRYPRCAIGPPKLVRPRCRIFRKISKRMLRYVGFFKSVFLVIRCLSLTILSQSRHDTTLLRFPLGVPTNGTLQILALRYGRLDHIRNETLRRANADLVSAQNRIALAPSGAMAKSHLQTGYALPCRCVQSMPAPIPCITA
jgi:hypothetical protein